MKTIALFCLTLLGFCLQATPLTVNIETAGLPAGNYLLDFQFIDGDAVVGNNEATVSGLSDTNVIAGALSTFGTVSGMNPETGLTLTDGPQTEVDLAFTSTNAAAPDFSFMVNTTANYTAPGPGDAFTVAITDTSLNSTRTAGNGAEIEIDINRFGPVISLYPADTAFGGFRPEAVALATPESPAWVYGFLSLVPVLASRHRRRRR